MPDSSLSYTRFDTHKWQCQKPYLTAAPQAAAAGDKQGLCPFTVAELHTRILTQPINHPSQMPAKLRGMVWAFWQHVHTPMRTRVAARLQDIDATSVYKVPAVCQLSCAIEMLAIRVRLCCDQ